MLLFLVALVAGIEQDIESKIEPNLTGIKCVVSGKGVNKNYSCPFKKGKVFFDCNESRRKFIDDRTAYIIKANHQLAVTGQYFQTKCPIKNSQIDRNSKVRKSIAGVEIGFCCRACVDQISTKANIHEQIRFIFDNRKFNSIFQPRIKAVGQSTDRKSR